jgi:predicted metal-dependent HD superfamily phosphohydrolase
MLYTPFEEEQILIRSGLLDVITHQDLEAVHANYNEPHRHYHAWHHALSTISWVNYCADEHSLTVTGQTQMEFAIAALYHDAVYDTQGSPANEQRSVEFMKQWLGNTSEVEIQQALPGAERLIMLTAQHGKLEPRDVSTREALFLDCDMASFGEKRWELVLWNELNIHREYLTKYTQEQVDVGRRLFLTGLLKKEWVFLSDLFRGEFEAQARQNIERLIERLA